MTWSRLVRPVAALVAMSRPVILLGGVLAYTFGATMGYAERGDVPLLPTTLGFVVTMLANLMAHYADEYADTDTDAITHRTMFSGGSGVLPAGTVPPHWALNAALVCAGLASVVCIGAVLGGWLPLAVLGIAGVGIVGGWCYAMPPFALERHGLGEIDNALLGGLLMPLMGYTAVAGTPSLSTILALAPVVAAVMICLLGVHWADRHADAVVGKRSLAVLLGCHTRLLHHCCTATTYLIVLGLSTTLLPAPVVSCALLTLPLALWTTLHFGHGDDPRWSVLTMVALISAMTLGWLSIGI